MNLGSKGLNLKSLKNYLLLKQHPILKPKPLYFISPYPDALSICI